MQNEMLPEGLSCPDENATQNPDWYDWDTGEPMEPEPNEPEQWYDWDTGEPIENTPPNATDENTRRT